MAVGVTEEHHALAEAVRGWAQQHAPVTTARAAAEGAEVTRPGFWPALAAQGLLGLHVNDADGGAGGTPVELAVAMEEFGHALVAGPFLPTVTVSAVLALLGGQPAAEHLPGLADGSTVAGLAFAPGSLTARQVDGTWRLDGAARPVMAADADLLLLEAATDAGARRWFLVDAQRAALQPVASLDATRRLAEVRLDDVEASAALPGLDADAVHEVAV